MRHPAPPLLKWAYSLTVLAAALPLFSVVMTGWFLSLTTGGYFVRGIFLLGPLTVLLVGLYRIYLVALVPGTLDSQEVAGVALALRRVGLFGLYAGIPVLFLSLLSLRFVKMLFTRPSVEPGMVSFLLLPLLGGGMGLLGLMLFELSRLLAFEKHAREEAPVSAFERPPMGEPVSAAPVEPPAETEPVPNRLEYTCNLADLQAFSLNTSRRQVRLNQLLLAFLVLFWSFSSSSEHDLFGTLITLALTAISVSLFPLIFRAVASAQLHKHHAEGRSKGILGWHRFSLLDEGLQEESEAGSQVTRYDAIDRFNETSTHVFIYLTAVQGYVIPRATVLAGNLETFLQNLRERIKGAGAEVSTT